MGVFSSATLFLQVDGARHWPPPMDQQQQEQMALRSNESWVWQYEGGSLAYYLTVWQGGPVPPEVFHVLLDVFIEHPYWVVAAFDDYRMTSVAKLRDRGGDPNHYDTLEYPLSEAFPMSSAFRTVCFFVQDYMKNKTGHPYWVVTSYEMREFIPRPAGCGGDSYYIDNPEQLLSWGTTQASTKGIVCVSDRIAFDEKTGHQHCVVSIFNDLLQVSVKCGGRGGNQSHDDIRDTFTWARTPLARLGLVRTHVNNNLDKDNTPECSEGYRSYQLLWLDKYGKLLKELGGHE
jgi:hypothetical protein